MKTQATGLSPHEIIAKLQAAGVNPTAQRLAISQYVLCEADHPTAEQVKEWTDRNFPMMSLATVYNTLNTLVKAGILMELRFPHTDRVVYDDRVTEHYHFLDEETGELVDVLPDQVEIKTKLKRNFKIKGVDVLIRGTRVN